MRAALITTLVLAWVIGTIVLIGYVLHHPPTGPEICDPVACQANPRYTPPTTPPPAPSPAPTPFVFATAGPDAWWRTVNPCHLLTTSQQRSLGFGAKRLVSQGSGTCALVEPPVTGQLTLSVPLRLTIDLPGYPYPLLGTVSRRSFVAADGRRGVIAQDQTTGQCTVTLQATKDSMALIYVFGSARNCELASTVASMISPDLPRSGIRAGR